MGEVMLARQVEPVERLVALKFLRSQSESPIAAEWFEQERQTLALMNHPCIAQIYDGGRTEDGTLYLVMEYVRGEPITTYCDRRRLDVHARLSLFADVCAAVQHAHQKAVIHRDLKPDNVLVAELDGAGLPKIIDFGIARALSRAPSRSLRPVEDVSVIGTPLYMSAEQLEPGNLGVDTRTDIYSLGVILYELLTGSLPTTGEGAPSVVPPPSAAVQGLDDVARTARAASCSTKAHELQRLLTGDLDAVVLRSMAKDRNDRYESAAELRADLVHFRKHEPVTALPPSPGYLVRRFIRRHRTLVAAATLVAISLLAVVASTTWGMLAAGRARDTLASMHERDLLQLTRVGAQMEFTDLVLFHLDPGTGDSSGSLREVLDQLAPTIAARYGVRPREEAGVRASVGHAYVAAGEPRKAMPHLLRAFELMQKDGGRQDTALLPVLNDLARASRLVGSSQKGNDYLAMVLEIGGAELRRAEPGLARSFDELARLARTEGGDAEFLRAFDAALTTIERLPRNDHVSRLVVALTGATGLMIADANIGNGSALLTRIGRFVESTYDDEVDAVIPVVRLSERMLRLGSLQDAKRLAAEGRATLDRLAIGRHWLRFQTERVLGLALSLDGEAAAGEVLLLALREQLRDLSPAANEHARAAANALKELCTRLQASGQLAGFLDASLLRWRKAALGTAWWPAEIDDAPPLARDLALGAVEAIGTEDRTALDRMTLGALLLRHDRSEPALVELEAAAAKLPAPPCELLADLARARVRLGNRLGAEAAVLALEAVVAGGDASPRARASLARARSDLHR